MDRVTDPADPERCHGKTPMGQCMNRAERGSDYCRVHGGSLSAVKAEDLRLYHLADARYRQRLAELSEHDPIRALNQVIAISRLLVEKRVNLIQEDADLLNAYRDLNVLQLTVARLVKTAHSIEQNLGDLLGKPSVLRFGQFVIYVVAEELSGIEGYNEVVSRIADQTIKVIRAANNNTGPVAIKVPSLMGRSASDAKTFLLRDVDDQVRLAELSKHERIKSLNEDIALQCILIEKRWNMASTPETLVPASRQLCDALKVLETQIKLAHEIEQSMGNLLTRDAASRIGSVVSQIIVDELELSDIPEFEKVTDRILDRIVKADLSTIPRQLALPAPQADAV